MVTADLFSVNFRCCELIWYPITNKHTFRFSCFFLCDLYVSFCIFLCSWPWVCLIVFHPQFSDAFRLNVMVHILPKKWYQAYLASSIGTTCSDAIFVVFVATKLARNVRFEHRTGKPATDHLYRGRSKDFCVAVVRWVPVYQFGEPLALDHNLLSGC